MVPSQALHHPASQLPCKHCLLTSGHSRLLGIFWKYVLTYIYEMHLNAYSGWISSCSVTPWFMCAAEPLTSSLLPTAVTSQGVCVLLWLDMLVLYRSWLLYIKSLWTGMWNNLWMAMWFWLHYRNSLWNSMLIRPGVQLNFKDTAKLLSTEVSLSVHTSQVDGLAA